MTVKAIKIIGMERKLKKRVAYLKLSWVRESYLNLWRCWTCSSGKNRDTVLADHHTIWSCRRQGDSLLKEDNTKNKKRFLLSSISAKQLTFTFPFCTNYFIYIYNFFRRQLMPLKIWNVSSHTTQQQWPCPIR